MITSFHKWADWFRKTPENQMFIDWSAEPGLSNQEKKAISRSIAMFQKGESSDGRIFLEKAMVATGLQPDQSYVQALRHFILEENRHSELLGRFMEAHDIPKIEHHWVDEIFRLIRKPGGLEQSIRVLVTAEIMAVPYYTALSSATESIQLKSICRQILADEYHHLQFQTDALNQCCKSIGKWRHFFSNAAHRIFLEQTCLVVWAHHRKVFRRGGYSFLQFRHECIFLWYKVTGFLQANKNRMETQDKLLQIGENFSGNFPNSGSIHKIQTHQIGRSKNAAL